MPRKKKQEPSTEPVQQGKDLFQFLDGIYTDQTSEFYDGLSEVEKKRYRYARYMIHRFLSMKPDYSPIVNALQMYSGIPDRAHYLFLANVIPRGKQYAKYIKGSKDEKYEKWLVELVAKHFHVSIAEAIQYLEIYYQSNKAALKELCLLYGVDSKQLKKAKL